MSPRIFRTIEPYAGVDPGADEMLEALNRPQRPRAPAALPVKAAGTAPVPHATRLEPRGTAARDVEPSAAFASLPPVLATIASVAGLDAALTLAEGRGGTRIYVPARAVDAHWLPRAIGREAADRLCAHYRVTDADGAERGTVLQLPLGGVGLRADTWRQIVDMIRQGYSTPQITMRLGVSRDTVKRHRAKLRQEIDGTQLSMIAIFDETAGRGLFEQFANAIAAELDAALALPQPVSTEGDDE